MATRDLTVVLQVAERAAEAAGELIRQWSGRPEVVDTKSGPHDLVTEVDRRCESVIRETIRDAFPDDFILGEETVAQYGGAEVVLGAEHEDLWVVDPIDGTTNFVAGIPFCSVSIAYAHRGILEVGMVYHPYLKEQFSAVRSGGAFLNGRPIRVSSASTLSESVLGTGFPSGEHARAVNTKGMVDLAPRCRNIRTLGSAALHLAYVACGRLTGFWETHLNPWDMAAGALLVQEAGGQVTDIEGRPYTLEVRHVVGTNGLIHGELLGRLKGAMAAEI
ncbi:MULTISPECIES: inositol monophosphatase family protein [Kyrpidia]|uniref:Inositol-1-monophosphatase n=2 Tax=Kyrpidia spormannii TaxID=2055160 RepID=A0ACA8ZB58_9BACL|nr:MULTISPECIES: inositol monophosphatase family protein [Kyrpidia]MCL6576769.1 inositol monophosphatase [Kyrpidia sp.]CAB3393145.1 Inositol-1-monophosphatase [Kyrpidia spormannii]CAB3394064.1 Inositol-1-monophosphatase [Kyrpidia spormannii]